ncbi:RE2 [Symbiodinium necroappetens]|uniref:RE2 protein n=1 Tax=Symbiodinium necroappetens TaxID=1628268 RepID=A0A813CD82_9DINO|nr:RE2 [Symbiodinium necroappetens]
MATQSASAVSGTEVLKDSFIPLFDGKPSSYKEYRQRLQLYKKKAKLNKKLPEATINLLTSLTGAAWRQVQHLAETAPDAEDGFDQVVKALDTAFQYDERVEMPKALDRYFYGGSRRPEQTLLQYCGEHRDALREVQKHGIVIPTQVDAWILLRRAGLTQEQRQLIQSQAGTKLEADKVEQAMYYLLGQDYRSAVRAPLSKSWSRHAGRAGYSSSGWRRPATSYSAEEDSHVTGDWDLAFEAEEAYTGHDFVEEDGGAIPLDDDADQSYLDDEHWDESAFYEEEQWDEGEEDDQFEEAYATYLDARRRLADVRASRGYYPVVAVVPGADSQLPVAAAPSSWPLGIAMPYASFHPSASFLTKLGQALELCAFLHIHALPAWTWPRVWQHLLAQVLELCSGVVRLPPRSCPTCLDSALCVAAPLGSSPGVVRLAYHHLWTSVSVFLLMPLLLLLGSSWLVASFASQPSAHTMPAYPSCNGAAYPACSPLGSLDSSGLFVQQDGGASAMLGGHRPVMHAINHLISKGLRPELVQFSRASKTFLFGGDASAKANWSVHLPVFIRGTPGRLQVFIVEGDTPILMGRPVLKALQVKTDFENDRCSVLGGEYTTAILGDRGEFLLQLDEGMDEDSMCQSWVFDLMTDEVATAFSHDVVPLVSMGDYLSETGRPGPEVANACEDSAPKVGVDPTASRFNSSLLEPAGSVGHLTPKLLKSLDVAVRQATNAMNRCLEEVLWTTLDTPPVFWEVYSGSGNLAKAMAKRGFCVRTFDLPEWDFRILSHRKAFRVLLEQERPHIVWMTPSCRPWLQSRSLSALNPHRRELLEIERWAVTLHQCALGVTHECLYHALSVDCPGHPVHFTAIGSSPDSFTSTSHQPVMCEALATALSEALPYALDSPSQEFALAGDESRLAHVEAVEADASTPQPDAEPAPAHRNSGVLASLLSERPAEAQRLIGRLHRNLGHPSPKQLADELKSRGASAVLVEAARAFQCPVCAQLAPPHQTPKSGLRTAKTFNERLLVDTLWISLPGGPTVPVLAMLDASTRFLSARPITSESSAQFLQGVERGWIRLFGPPQVLQVDAHPSWSSAAARDWATEHSIEHQVLRRAIDVFVASTGGHTHDDLKRALDLAKLDLRAAAGKAVIEADSDERLRRALLRKSRVSSTVFQVGQRVFYWRDGSGVGPRVRWKGPATVVMVENDDRQSRQSVIWLVRGAQLIRAAPEHLRRDLLSEEPVGQAPAQALEALRKRGPTSYLDLPRSNRRPLEDLCSEDESFEPDPKMRRVEQSVQPSSAAPAPPPAASTSEFPVQPTVTGEPAPEDHLSDYSPSEMASEEPAAAPVPAQDSPAPPSVQPQASPTTAEGSNREHPATKPRSTEQPSGSPPPSAPDTSSLHPSFAPPSVPETFAQRRARVDQQETFSFRVPFYGAARPPPYRHGPYAPPPDEEAEHALVCDVLEQSTMSLPPGWRCDAQGGMALDGVFDQWEWRGRSLIRRHYVARDSLFDPRSPGDCPVPVQWLSKGRSTWRGRQRHDDRWRSDLKSSSGSAFWTGCTAFKIQPRYLEQAKEQFFAVSEGHESFSGVYLGAGATKKASSLDERTLSLSDQLLFQQAKRKELESFFQNGVWHFDDQSSAPAGRVLKAHFILKWAKHPDGSPRAKARLITQGFKDPDALNGLVDRMSPTLTRLARHIMLSLAATLKWQVCTGDISTAFLQGKEHDSSRTLWIRLPADARKMLGVTSASSVMRLRKPMYGLVDAPRAWYAEATARLESLGFRRHPLDRCLFLYHDPNKLDEQGRPTLVAMIGMYVDDLLCIGDASDDRFNSVVTKLRDAFAFREWHQGEESVEYLGAQVDRLPDDTLKYHQNKYLSKLHPITVEKGRLANPSTPVTDKERTKLRALIGGLQWAATQSAPHVQPLTSFLSGQTSSAKVSTLQAANKALRYAKQNADVGLLYSFLGPLEDLVVVGYSDASFANREDLSSQGGYLVTLCHRDALEQGVAFAYHVLDWRSFRLPRIARSTLSAESQAAAEAADAVYYASLFLKCCLDPGLDLAAPGAAALAHPSALVVDAKALYDLLAKDELQAALGAEKRTAVEVLVTKQKLSEANAAPRWVSSERQLADGLTKESASQLLANRLRTHRNRLQDDRTYEAARRKDPERRQASANEFALTRAQAVGCAFVASSPKLPDSVETSTGLEWFDVWLAVLTTFVGLLLARCLLVPWTWVPRRLVLQERTTQTVERPIDHTASQTTTSSSPVSNSEVQTQVWQPVLVDAAIQTDQVADRRGHSLSELPQVSAEVPFNACSFSNPQ